MSPLGRLRGWLDADRSSTAADDPDAAVYTTASGRIHVDEHEVHDREALELVDEILEEVRN